MSALSRPQIWRYLTLGLFGLGLLLGFLQPAYALTIPNPNGTPWSQIQAQPAAGCATAGTNTTSSGTTQTGISQTIDIQCEVNTVTNRILTDAFLLMGIIAVLMLVYSGIMYIQANGNAEATKKARQAVFNVILGIILLTASYTIISLINGTIQFFAPSS